MKIDFWNLHSQAPQFSSRGLNDYGPLTKMELLQPHPLEYTLEKAGEVLDNTIRNLAKPGKEATSVVEK